MITHGNALDWTDLVFPLARHDLSVGTRNLDSGVKTSAVVSVSDDSTEAVVGADGAIVWSLGSGISVVRPSDGPGCELSLSSNQGILLLDSVPWLFVSTGVENCLGVASKVGVSWLELLAGGVLPLVSLGHDDEVLALSEWIAVVGDRLHDDFRVVGGGLVAR